MNMQDKIHKIKVPITLAFTLVFFLTYPYLSGKQSSDGLPELAISFMFLIIPCLSMFLKHKKGFACVCLLALISIAIATAAIITKDPILVKIAIAAEFFFFLFTFIMVIKHIFSHDQVTIHQVLTAILGYLLIALLFAFIYTYASFYNPNILMFITDNIGATRSYWHFNETLYFSLVTLTSLGYGDIVPVGGHIRMLAAIEAVVGQMYIAVFMARLVGIMISQKLARQKNK